MWSISLIDIILQKKYTFIYNLIIMIRKYYRVKENKTKLMKHIKAMIFPVVMCGCDSRTIQKAECQRIDAFILWDSWESPGLPWIFIGRRSNQSILKEINPEYSLERLILKLKLQYFGHLMGKANLLEKTLMLGKIEGRRKRGGGRRWDHWMASPTQWPWIWADSGR